MWVGGMTVYGVCIFVANALLFVRFHNHTAVGTICFFVGISSYFIFFVFTSAVLHNEIDHLFQNNFKMRLVSLTITFAVGYALVAEGAIRVWKQLIYSDDRDQISQQTMQYLPLGDDIAVSSSESDSYTGRTAGRLAVNDSQYSKVAQENARNQQKISSYAFSQYENANVV